MSRFLWVNYYQLVCRKEVEIIFFCSELKIRNIFKCIDAPKYVNIFHKYSYRVRKKLEVLYKPKGPIFCLFLICLVPIPLLPALA